MPYFCLKKSCVLLPLSILKQFLESDLNMEWQPPSDAFLKGNPWLPGVEKGRGVAVLVACDFLYAG